MDARTTPEDGDIGVREETRDGTLVYVLHTAPGSDPSVLRSRQAAVAQAVTLAKREHVRAWLADEGYDFALLVDFRRGGIALTEVSGTWEGLVMAKSAKRKTDEAVSTAADRSSTTLPNRVAPLTDSDVARSAYDLYVARGGEHGHDMETGFVLSATLRASRVPPSCDPTCSGWASALR